MIKTICFINNYNNEKYIRDCLESVYSQSTPFDQVILVDDGSTDSSLKIIAQTSSRYKNFYLLLKENEGQLSTFNFICSLIPDNAQIFLLDGDDVYPSDYLAALLGLLGDGGWDFSFCEQQKFVDNEVHMIKTAVINEQPCYYFSSTTALARSRGCWIGNPTSCLSVSSRMFKKIFPYPNNGGVTLWADNLMIYASSILGARKIYVPSLGIGYREHGTNDSKKPHTPEYIVSKRLAIENAFNWYCKKYSIPRYPRVSEFFEEYEQLGGYWQKRLDLPSKYRMLNRLVRASTKQFFRKIV